MSSYLLDTDVLIDYSRGNPRAKDFLEKARSRGDRLFISMITMMELAYGCRDKDEIKKIGRLCQGFWRIKINRAISGYAIDIIKKYGRTQQCGILDALVAGTAMHLGAPLVTGNTDHFSMIKGLSLYKPY
jgi:predicted nucleic acid-binding protein